MGKTQPWCCLVSAVETYDPFAVSKDAFDQCPLDAIPVPPNWSDDLAGPGVARGAVSSARVWACTTRPGSCN